MADRLICQVRENYIVGLHIFTKKANPICYKKIFPKRFKKFC